MVTLCVSLEHSGWLAWAFHWPSFNSWQGGLLMSWRDMWLRYLCHRSRSCIDKLFLQETCKRSCQRRACQRPLPVKNWTGLLANGALKMLPVYEWKAACGWKFGLGEYSFSPVPGQLSGRCKGCFRVSGDEAVDGGSSSGWSRKQCHLFSPSCHCVLVVLCFGVWRSGPGFLGLWTAIQPCTLVRAQLA